MVSIGLSIFLGSREPINKQKEMIIRGEELGYTELFFEVENTELLRYARELLSIANKLDYYSFINVTPELLLKVGASPANMNFFKQLGFSAVKLSNFRLDDILKVKEIGIELNPSKFPVEKLKYFLDKIDDPERVKASHDYYPKGRGIKLSELVEISKPFASLDIPVAAFVCVPSSKVNCTVEELRDKNPSEAARVLLETEVIDRVLIGDRNPTDKDLEELSIFRKGY